MHTKYSEAGPGLHPRCCHGLQAWGGKRRRPLGQHILRIATARLAQHITHSTSPQCVQRIKISPTKQRNDAQPSQPPYRQSLHNIRLSIAHDEPIMERGFCLFEADTHIEQARLDTFVAHRQVIDAKKPGCSCCCCPHLVPSWSKGGCGRPPS